ncbi:MAG: AbrB/MazE/SpoVT family DNA-binding domain-containing protein, partial [Clostridia bacterium]|nr:AbrB/MazE/SpoVT family DNA-binding domain-containing protein [Clostridia bacterium]
MTKSKENRFIVSVKVGPKGQITVPKEARDMFGIEVGDTLMVLGDAEKGLAIVKSDEFYKLMGDKY